MVAPFCIPTSDEGQLPSLPFPPASGAGPRTLFAEGDLNPGGRNVRRMVTGGLTYQFMLQTYMLPRARLLK